MTYNGVRSSGDTVGLGERLVCRLTWGLSSGAVSTYVLEVGSTPGATNLGVYEVGTGTDYRVSGVANGTYYVRMRARNPCGLSSPSSNATSPSMSRRPVRRGWKSSTLT